MGKSVKIVSTIFLALVLLAGIGLMAYPTASNWWNSRYTARVVSEYARSVGSGSEEDHAAELEAARLYNQKLLGRQADIQGDEPAMAEYGRLLDPAGNGVMCYVSIDRIGVELPVYHGTGDVVLQRAAGHLYGSSLPVGGPGTHACISGHTGLPGAKLFTGLDELEDGDTFTIQVLGEVLTYRVDDISVVLPEDVAGLSIVPGEDYCTLITCTPYGINSHRLLVRGVRTENLPEDEVRAEQDIKHAMEQDSGQDTVLLYGLLAAAGAGAAVAAATVAVISRKSKKKARRTET